MKRLSIRSIRTATTAIALLFVAVCSIVQAEDPIRVAIFEGDGVGRSVDSLLTAIQSDGSEKVEVRRMTADEIRSGKLAEIDVLVHPGGSGSGQGKALGEDGRKAVVQFVKSGGGYLGVCAGAYLATNDYDWSLHLIDAKCIDRKHWARGKGTVSLKLSSTASTFFGHVGEQIDIHYGQGPLLGRPEWDDTDVPDYESLAIYETGIAEKGAPAGVMPGTSAIVRANYGAGRVFCFSPHPESTEGRESMISAAVAWLAQVTDEHALEIAEVSHVVRKHVPKESSGGIAVLITKGDEVLHRKGYGFVKGKHLTTKSPLSLASVSKQYAAMCAAMLIEEGRLDLKQKVSYYLPDLKLPMEGRELLVQDLLWHTSGLANFIKAKEKATIVEYKKEHRLDYLTNKTHAQWLTTMELKRPPGQEFEYTNSGYVLLTRIIEVVTGETFHDFQQRRIFDVLELTATTDSTRFNGSGNMKTTLVDYTKWDRALWKQDPRLLSPSSYEMLFTQGAYDNSEPIDYGFGWRLNYRDDELLTAEHGGVGSGTTAARNLIRRHFVDQTTVAIFAQENPEIGRTDRETLVSELYETLLKQRSSE
jgi:CubicO group peptidase (beta-lactamase class C family)